MLVLCCMVTAAKQEMLSKIRHSNPLAVNTALRSGLGPTADELWGLDGVAEG